MPTWTVPIQLTWGYGQGSPGANVFHARTTGGAGPSADLESMTEALHDFYTACAGLFNSTMSIRWLGEATGVGDDTGSVATSPSWTVVGTDSSSVAPPALAMLVNWRADTGGRSGRGKTFLGPLAASTMESNGTPAEGVRTTALTAAQDLIETSDTFANGALGIYSRVDNVFRDFISATVPNDFAVLRSRRD